MIPNAKVILSLFSVAVTQHLSLSTYKGQKCFKQLIVLQTRWSNPVRALCCLITRQKSRSTSGPMCKRENMRGCFLIKLNNKTQSRNTHLLPGELTQCREKALTPLWPKKFFSSPLYSESNLSVTFRGHTTFKARTFPRFLSVSIRKFRQLFPNAASSLMSHTLNLTPRDLLWGLAAT